MPTIRRCGGIAYLLVAFVVLGTTNVRAQDEAARDAAATEAAATEATEPDVAAAEELYVDDAAVEEPSVDEGAIVEADDPLVRELNAQLHGGGADPSGGPLAGSQTAPLVNLGRWVVSVSLVIALILVLYAAARRFGSRTPFLAGADLGHVIGRVYLSRQAVLYYVETGGRVLVIGVTNTTIALVSEFDAAAFDEDAEGPAESVPANAAAFLSQLEQSSRAMRGSSAAPVLDRDMSSMKSDLERMRRMLADEEEGARR